MSTASPRHLAIIMDGNGRWAKRRRLPRQAGHLMGASGLKRIVRACADRGVEYLTIFAFSTENWRRPADEVSALMSLFIQYLTREVKDMREQGVRLRIIGDRAAFDKPLQSLIEEAEAATAHNTRLNLTVAANYGGQWDILNAAQSWSAQHPGEPLTSLSQQELAEHLSTAGMPDPDLLIRTGGESRISNFMLWQLAYTEFFFTDALWPDFDEKALDEALNWFGTRVRRFGKTDDQVSSAGLKSYSMGESA
jgi:undecaprenyl diphosphate synthase